MAMQNYEELLNDSTSKVAVNIQAIYDMVYAPEISTSTISNFTVAIRSIDEAVTADGTRAIVIVKEIGKPEERLTLSKLDPQLREVVTVCLRFRHKVRDEASVMNDYNHMGLRYGYRLYGEKNLTLPNGKRAGDVAELGIAMREYLGLYKQIQNDQNQ